MSRVFEVVRPKTGFDIAAVAFVTILLLALTSLLCYLLLTGSLYFKAD